MDVKDAAETFELLCTIKQIPYDKLEVLRHLTPMWDQDKKITIIPTGEQIELPLEIIGVKDYDGIVHHVGYFVKEHNGKVYTTLPIFRCFEKSS